MTMQIPPTGGCHTNLYSMLTYLKCGWEVTGTPLGKREMCKFNADHVTAHLNRTIRDNRRPELVGANIYREEVPVSDETIAAAAEAAGAHCASTPEEETVE